MILAKDVIEAMCEGMSRVRRTPEKEWLAPVIERLRNLKPSDRLVIEVLDLNNPVHRHGRVSTPNDR